jgi:23S rRNA pseudouridine1911/1915/1917 synthase
LNPSKPSPQILLEDGPILALNKPAGLATEAPAGLPSLVEWVKAYLKEKHQKPGNVYLGVPHRLDRPVTGVVVMTRNSKAAARMAQQFRDRQVKKTYLAVVEGRPDPSSGTLVHWTSKNTEGKAEIVEPMRADAKECLLRYETMATFPFGTLLRIDLGTGRYHQIRVQMSASGWPIVGDVPYGGKPFEVSESRNENGPPKEGPLLLHALRLMFFHPVRYDLVSASAPLPAYWPADVRAVVADAETGLDLHPHP